MLYNNNNLTEQEKRIKHEVAAKAIERQVGKNLLNDVDELIFHLKMAKQNDKVKAYALDNAEKMKYTKNFLGQVKNLEIALDVCTDPVESAQIMLKIGEILLDMGDSPQAKEYLHRAEVAALEIKDKYLELDVCLNLASCYSSEGKIENYNHYIDKVDDILKETNYEKAKIERKVFEALAHINFNNLEASQKLCEEILEECGEKYNKIRGNALRILGYINLRKNNLEEALEINYKSIELLETVNYAKGLLFSLNNIGIIYSEHYGDIEKGINFFFKVRDLSQEYGLLSTEVLGTVNVGVMTRKNLDFKGAYDNYKHALAKAKKINAQSEIFFIYTALISLCLEIDNFEEAIYYFNLCNEDLVRYTVQGEKKLPIYEAYSLFYQTFGLFNEAAKYLRESIEYESGETGEINSSAIIEGYVLDIMSKNVTCYQQIVNSIIQASHSLVNTVEKITTLCEVAKMVGQRGQIECAKKLINEVEKYIDDKTHDYLMAKYFLAKGISEKGNGRKYIRKAMLIGKRFNSRTILLQSYLELADSYFNEQEYYISAYYYVEVWEIFKNLLKQLPDNFKLSYANEFGYLRSFYRAIYIKEILGIKTDNNFSELEDIENLSRVDSLNELQKITNYNIVKLFVNSKKFMESISKKSLGYENTTYKELDILSNLTGSTIDDMESIVKFIAAKMLATRGLLIINHNNHSMEVVGSSDGDYNLPSDKYFFDKVKKNLQPIVVYRGITGERELNHLREGIRACICMPITSDYSHGFDNNMASKILGFLYLESDRALTNFGNDSIKKSSTLNNLLALLIEKHQLKISASIDKLTGTLTRKYLEDTLNSVFENAVEKNEIFSILMYDLDRFKDINDRFGHQTGDDVLAKLSKIVTEELKQNNYIGRYGGEEFVVILPKTSSEEAFVIAEQIRQRVQNKKILGEKANVTISIGIASYPEQGRNVMELIEKADQALYVAKEKGRNRGEIWKQEFSSKSKTKDNLRGIISGNTVKDSRNMLAMVELTQLTNKNFNREEKIYKFIGRMIETIEAQSGCLFLLNKDIIVEKFGRKSQTQEWDNTIAVNDSFIRAVITNKEGIYTIDWDDIGKNDFISGISNWSSVVVTPIIVRETIKGVLYFKTSTRHKEFDYSDLSIVNLLGDLLATVL